MSKRNPPDQASIDRLAKAAAADHPGPKRMTIDEAMAAASGDEPWNSSPAKQFNHVITDMRKQAAGYRLLSDELSLLADKLEANHASA